MCHCYYTNSYTVEHNFWLISCFVTIFSLFDILNHDLVVQLQKLQTMREKSSFFIGSTPSPQQKKKKMKNVLKRKIIFARVSVKNLKQIIIPLEPFSFIKKYILNHVTDWFATFSFFIRLP